MTIFFLDTIQIFQPSVRFIKGDIRDQGSVDEAIEGADVVFHLAASVGNKRSIDHPIADAEINVIGTLKVLESARKHEFVSWWPRPQDFW